MPIRPDWDEWVRMRPRKSTVGFSLRGRLCAVALALLACLLGAGLTAQEKNDPKVLNQAALERMRQGRLDEALVTVREALALDPDNPETLNTLGRILREKGSLEEAINAFEKAIELKPDFPGALYNLSEALAANGEFEKSREIRKRALQSQKAREEKRGTSPPAPASGGKMEHGVGPAGAESPERLPYAVQVAAYESRDTAVALAKRLTSVYPYTALVDPLDVRGKVIYRVRIRVSSRPAAEALAERVRREQNLDTWIVSLPE